ncbi:MAG: polyprenol monophosphomannose synthase [Candidatus Cloacimonetes bacterium]|nr:polyprenol monophosphomannose synthase [Candidatus Cloacimonadota bacterium]
MRTLVIIPTYNEIENAPRIVEYVLGLREDIEILIVDDNSPDGTGELMEQMKVDSPRLHLMKRAGKLGLGSAYVDGFKYALKKGYDFIVEMDADFSHNPDDILRMLNEIEHNDLVIGSRYSEGINVVNWPFKRLLLSYFASWYVRIITGMPFSDPTAGFKCYRRKLLENINFDSIISDGYSFQIEMKYRAWQKKFRIKEIPIVFTERRDGQSKMSSEIVYEAIWNVWKLRFMKLS